MKLLEIIQALDNGEKLRESTWEDGAYIQMVNGKIIYPDGETIGRLTAGTLFSEPGRWVVYEELHNFAWALEQLREGHPVCRKVWGRGDFILYTMPRQGLSLGDIFATDWVHYAIRN